MKKVILKWKVNKTVQTSCPYFKPDPYTGEYPTIQCSVYHCKQVTEAKSKEFDSKEEAEKFKENAPNACYDFQIT